MSDGGLQEICRYYLARLRPIAERFGLARFVDDTVEANMNERCKGTEEEVEMLSRMCGDERIAREDIPSLLGKSYRKSCKDGDFDKVRKLTRSGIYSKVSAMLLKNEQGKPSECNDECC